MGETERIMKKYKFAALIAGVASLSLATVFVAFPSQEVCAAEQMSFREDVAPILLGRCVSCHHPGGEGTAASGLDLTTYAGLMKGTKFGPMVVPGSPETSNLMAMLDWRVSAEIRMPHGKKKLSTCDRNAIRSWIQQGAKDN
jgi:hypothetical protein